MSRDGDYIVCMGDIIVPNVYDIDVKKNLINANPRGIIDIELSGRNMMPASCVVKTKTNVEDYFRMNAPLIVLKKIGLSAAEGTNALLTYSYLQSTKWFDSNAVGIEMAGLIGMGYLPVFLGVVRSFHTSSSTSADSATYEHIIAGQDLQTFMHNRFDFDSVNFDKGADCIRDNKFIQQAGIKGVDVSDPNIPVKTGYLPRQRMVNTTIRYLLDKNDLYREQFLVRERIGSAIAGVTTGAIATKPSVQDIAAISLAKTLLFLKIPKTYEPEQEAIPINSLQTFFSDVTKHDSTIMTMLPGLTPRYFYETFVREDTGEFVFRRASWYGNKDAPINRRQRFQNPHPIIAPVASLTTYQKVYGGKMGELVGGKVHGHTIVMDQQYSLGPLNRQKFGTARHKPTPDNLDWFPFNLESLNEQERDQLREGKLLSTLDFINSSYYDIPDQLIGPNYSDVDEDRRNAARKAASWISKYYHSYSYVTWLGFSTYFPAPLGAVMYIPMVPAITQHLPAPVASGFGLRNRAFTLQEELNTYRITGKALKVAYRKDGSYQEEYNILLSNAGLGLRQDA